MTAFKIKEFFDTDVKAFSTYDCVRSLPSGIDGFKPSMRKIIFGMRKKFNNEEVKLSIAAAGIQSVAAYHHGSLEGTIVKMAQSFVGSNNIPFLLDIGQFGSRISPDAAASRYIFTKLTDAYDNIFNSEDEDILEYLDDDGIQIEPKFYLPIIPTVLVNGSDGMGTGFACRILNYDPRVLCNESIRILNGQSAARLVPWYRGFRGKIDVVGNQVSFTGTFERLSTTQIRITELPIGQYTTRYRETLNDLEDKGLIKTYEDNSTEDATSFLVTCPRETLRTTDEELLKTFKLVSRETENFTVWTENDKLHKFDSASNLLEWFVSFRLLKYEQRRQNIVNKLSKSIDEVTERIRFIEYYISNSTTVSKMRKDDFVVLLQQNDFKYIDDLLSIRVYNLTMDQIEIQREKLKQLIIDKDSYENATAKDLYKKDLQNLQKFLNKTLK